MSGGLKPKRVRPQSMCNTPWGPVSFATALRVDPTSPGPSLQGLFRAGAADFLQSPYLFGLGLVEPSGELVLGLELDLG
jgi:hypothetical protein